MSIKEAVTSCLLLLASTAVSWATETKTNATYTDYIEKYHKIAVEEMKEYGIPASITLAQGLLESGAGNSQLAKMSNNHFGIKCHDWKGDRVYFDDDEKGECFRKYDDPEESYKDHATFLKEKPRYAALFDLQTTDYKNWAKGLKQYGYATDPNYANRLIDLIETYGLSEYDQKGEKKNKDKKKNPNGENGSIDNVPFQKPEVKKIDYKLKSTMGVISMVPMHNVEKRGKKSIVIAQKDDSYESIAEEFGLKKWEIRKYNKVKKGATPEDGQEVIISLW